MITTILLNLAYKMLSGFIALFPVGTGFSDTVHSSFQTLGGYFQILDPLIPISTITASVLFIFAMEISLYAFRMFKWLMSFVPFFGGKGV